MTPNPVDQCFTTLRASKRKAFIPFITAGDPSLSATTDIIKELTKRGADIIELGLPYSDPLADGPVIQASYTRALKAGIRLDAIFAAAKEWTNIAGDTPLVAMTAYSLVYRRGPEQFLAKAKEAGFAGLIIPDLPLEELGDLATLATAKNLKLIQLVTPTTPRDRAARIAKLSTGFLYVVSVVGITGERAQLSGQLRDQLAFLRTQTDLPLCIGFGISKPEQVKELAPLADGIIVGSALVKHLENAASQPWPAVLKALGDHASQLRAPLAS